MLAEHVNTLGEATQTFEYPGTTHALKDNSRSWFSPLGV